MIYPGWLFISWLYSHKKSLYRLVTVLTSSLSRLDLDFVVMEYTIWAFVSSPTLIGSPTMISKWSAGSVCSGAFSVGFMGLCAFWISNNGLSTAAMSDSFRDSATCACSSCGFCDRGSNGLLASVVVLRPLRGLNSLVFLFGDVTPSRRCGSSEACLGGDIGALKSSTESSGPSLPAVNSRSFSSGVSSSKDCVSGGFSWSVATSDESSCLFLCLACSTNSAWWACSAALSTDSWGCSVSSVCSASSGAGFCRWIDRIVSLSSL
ncbi:hypothetical protein OGAPHI_000695 [Ogataea philodendri]|uniref:Uncharacterized protein n=1 Tax=Ogataea philodendri TaxID=1378263 RepID=A0A9P8T9W1_9ASCO|nr:uncharacterized protein OGAPHI_000695 [Ogataea philodendri]KAH3670984.1 hypothetical protein OGAPHI_000695 [Ogataea philodendri]